MLVLSRRERENIRLGNDIVVTVVKITGDKVRLGVEAPPSVLVLRGELDRRGADTVPAQTSIGKDERNEDLPATD
jgi:carbon storage regulator